MMEEVAGGKSGICFSLDVIAVISGVSKGHMQCCSFTSDRRGCCCAGRDEAGAVLLPLNNLHLTATLLPPH